MGWKVKKIKRDVKGSNNMKLKERCQIQTLQKRSSCESSPSSCASWFVWCFQGVTSEGDHEVTSLCWKYFLVSFTSHFLWISRKALVGSTCRFAAKYQQMPRQNESRKKSQKKKTESSCYLKEKNPKTKLNPATKPIRAVECPCVMVMNVALLKTALQLGVTLWWVCMDIFRRNSNYM